MTTTIAKMSRQMEDLDILFKNFFNNDSFYAPVIDTKIGHPVDIKEDMFGLWIQIACIGLDKEQINITTEGDVIRITYEKDATDEKDTKYYHRGISRKSFNLGYRIPTSKYDLENATPILDKGLLSILIPTKEEAKPKTLTIK